MALTGWSTSNYLTRAAAVASTRPLLFSGWGYRTAAQSSRLLTTGVSGSGDNFRHLSKSNTETIQAFERDTVSAGATTAAVVADATWFHASGWFISNTEREALYNGGDLATNATDKTPGAADITRIGVNPAAGNPWDTTGAIAEVSIWDATGMDATERRALDTKLAAGGNPLIINAEVGQPWAGLLLAYWPLRTASDLTDKSGNGHDMSMTGTLTTFATHPPVRSPGATTVRRF